MSIKMRILVITAIIFSNSIAFSQKKNAVIFAEGVVSTKENSEYGITFINDNLLLFTRSKKLPEIFYSKRIDKKWTYPQRAEFNSPYGEEYPFYSKKFGRVYFASKRPIPGSDTPQLKNDLWFVEVNANNSFTSPQHIGGALSTPGIESGPSVSDDGTLFFHSNRNGSPGLNGIDLFFCKPMKKKYASVYRLPVSSLGAVDGEAYIDPKKRFVIFMSNGNGSKGQGDLFISYRKKEKWLAPISLGPLVNTSAWEGNPSLSPSKDYLFFSRDVNGQNDIYFIPVKLLPIRQ